MSEYADQVQSYLSRVYGLKQVPQNKTYVQRVIDHFIEEKIVESEKELAAHLEKGSGGVYQQFVNAITVQESYFFRDQSLFVLLDEVVIPQLVSKAVSRDEKKLSIWSAGCSAGQELYSIAYLLRKHIVDIEQWDIYLLGTDINTDAIISAEKASYRSFSVRAMDNEMIQKLFAYDNDTYQLIPSLQKMAEFKYQNLASEDYPGRIFDIILCRNVFIYLSVPAIQSCLEKFYSLLDQDGYLFLGASDFISNVKSSFIGYFGQGVTYFRKSEEAEVQRTPIIKASEMPAPVAELRPVLDSSYRDTQINEGQLIREINTDISQNDYINALKRANQFLDLFEENAYIYRLRATALVGLADIDTAHADCEAALFLDHNDARTYFLKGMIEMDLHRWKDAERSFQHAVEHDSNYSEAYYHLGLLHFRTDQQAQGIEALEKALQLAKQKSPNERVEHSEDGIDFKEFVKAIEGSLSVYREGG